MLQPPSLASALRLCTERVNDAEEQNKVQLLDGVCSGEKGAARQVEGTGDRLCVNFPNIEEMGEVGTVGSAASSGGDITATTTTTGIGGTGTWGPLLQQ